MRSRLGYLGFGALVLAVVLLPTLFTHATFRTFQFA